MFVANEKKLAVAVIHGMGDQASHFADGLIDALSKRLKRSRRAAVSPDAVLFKPIWWAPVIQGREDDMWRAMKSGGELDFQSLRRFVLSNLGDAVAYQQEPGVNNTTYAAIHSCVADTLGDMRATLGVDRPLLLLAHSLGGAILSNYIWDRQNGTHAPTPFERMETLCGFVTFGCNIPLFTLAYRKVESIEFPPPSLQQHYPQLAPVAQWLNFYDRDDVLGWPLRPLGQFNGDATSPRRYDKAVSQDIEINVGGPLASWNPLSHSDYWTDDDFTEPVADLIATLLANC